VKEKLIRYRPGIDPKPKSRTDWVRVDRMIDDEIEAAARSDPDAQPMSDEELAACIPHAQLRVLRDRLGLTRQKFARRFGIDVRTVRRWEETHDKPRGPTPTYVRVIGAVLDALQD
jgi:putative transcriptional regulator